MTIARPATRRRPGLAAPLLAAGLAVTAFGATASEESVDRVTQRALALDAHPQHGGEVFTTHCARCHGPTGHGNAQHDTPALAGQRFAYLVRQLAGMASDQRDSMTMHRVLASRKIRDAQIWVDVAAYLNAQPVAAQTQHGNGQHLGLGSGIFREQCASCHRADASGDDDGFVPALRNQHYGYLVLQLNRMADGSRHNVDESLVQFFRSLGSDEIDGVADYLSRQHGRAGDREHLRSNGVTVD